jgi:DNA-binding SARP family transcriptional activator
MAIDRRRNERNSLVHIAFSFRGPIDHLMVGSVATGALSSRYRRAVLEFRILGPLEVVGERGPIRLGGPRQRAILALLLLRANTVVSVDQLADGLYSGVPPVTAVTQVQRQISELRKAFSPEAPIETRAPGYVIRLGADQLDLHTFERLTGDASQALARGDAQIAAGLLRQALALWRGASLGDLSYESFAQAAIERLDEIRLAALEQRVEADLACGRHAQLVGELEELVSEHPLHESFCGQLMLALYRSGRQAEALATYRQTRQVLVDALGIEPTPALHELERAILAQDQSLELDQSQSQRMTPEPQGEGAVLVPLLSDREEMERLLTLAESFVTVPPRELIIARLVTDESDVRQVAAKLNERRAEIKGTVRTAAFTTDDAAADVLRLATVYNIALTLLDAPPDLDEQEVPKSLREIFERSPGDVAVLVGTADLETGDGVFVPFGGGEHDWSALEIGAWLAAAHGLGLRLVGTKSVPLHGQRDASRLLADASLAVQRVAGVDAEPLLAEVSDEGLVAAVEPASLVVIGISPHWRRDGIGAARRALLRGARPPILLVHGGPRPGGLAPGATRTRFTWSVSV